MEACVAEQEKVRSSFARKDGADKAAGAVELLRRTLRNKTVTIIDDRRLRH